MAVPEQSAQLGPNAPPLEKISENAEIGGVGLGLAQVQESEEHPARISGWLSLKDWMDEVQARSKPLLCLRSNFTDTHFTVYIDSDHTERGHANGSCYTDVPTTWTALRLVHSTRCSHWHAHENGMTLSGTNWSSGSTGC